jgi:pyruvate/2-oxoglutarate dehydrogenase complex dihydrolipoamide acyltransferase (E2) component
VKVKTRPPVGAVVDVGDVAVEVAVEGASLEPPQPETRTRPASSERASKGLPSIDRDSGGSMGGSVQQVRRS